MADIFITVVSGETTNLALAVPGVQGPMGLSTLPSGGTTGQIIIKESAVDYDAAWTSTVSGLTLQGATRFALGSSGSPSITFSGDTNTGIYSPSADTLAFVEGGVEAMRIDSSGRLLLGTNANITGFKIQSIGSSPFDGISFSASANGPQIRAVKSRSATPGTYASVLVGDTLGSYDFAGDDGTAFATGARIVGVVDSTPDTGSIPGRLLFQTVPSGSSAMTERLRIASDGRHTINSTGHGGTALTTTAPAKLFVGNGTYNDTATAASGIVAHGTIFAIENPAISATNSGITYTNASTVYIHGNPTASTNVTIDNPFALFVAQGISRFNGNILLGQATNLLTVGGTPPSLQLAATSTSNGAHLHISRFNNDTACGLLSFGKSRNATAGTLGAIVEDNDELANIDFFGDDGTVFAKAASIRAQVDGIPALGSVPGRLLFSTTASGLSPTERMRITNAGRIGIGTTAPAALAHIGGDTIISNVNVAGASYDGISFSVATEETTPNGLFFSPDGRKMFIAGGTGDDVSEYTLSTPWNVSTATYVTAFSVSGQDITPSDIYFRADGRKMYMVGTTNDSIYQYTLSTPWSVASASYDSISYSVATEEITPTGMFLKSDGLAVYIVGQTADTVYRYNLSTAWNISTASLANSFSVAGQETGPTALTFASDGSRLFVLGSTGDDVNIYSLTTPWDITTASFVTVFSVAAQETLPQGIYLGPDGTKFYIVGTGNDTVYQYSIPSAIINLTGTTNAYGDLNVAENLTVDGEIIGSGALTLSTADASSTPTPHLLIASSGNVGIGTTAPLAKLDIAASGAGTELLRFSTERAWTFLQANTGAASELWLKDLTGNKSFRIVSSIDDTVVRTVGNNVTSASNRVYLHEATTGRVAIGNTNPGGTLHVTAGSGIAPFIAAGPVSEYASIDSSGRLLVGTSTSIQVPLSSSTLGDPGKQLASTNQGSASSAQYAYAATASIAPNLILARSRGALNTQGLVSSGDSLGRVTFQGSDGQAVGTNTGFIRAAVIEAQVDGVASAGAMPGRLVFSTTADGAASPTERLRIDSAGFISLGGDINTGFSNPSADNLAITTGGSERCRVDSSGRLLVGTSASRAAYLAGSSYSPSLQIESSTTAGLSLSRFVDITDSTYVALQKGRGTAATPTAVLANDFVGGITFSGHDGTNFVNATLIRGAIDGTPGTGSMPGRLVFSTTTDGAVAPTERLRITNDGVLGYNQAAPAAVNATATLTAANLKTGIITSTSVAATDMTLPSGTDTEAGFSGLYTNFTFEWSVINTGPSLVRVLAGTAHTVVGSGSVATGTSGRFASRRTAANTFVTYRLS